MLLRKLIFSPCWDYGFRLSHLCCWTFDYYYRLCRGCCFHGLVLADHWWYQNTWIFLHLWRYYSLACSWPWLMLYQQRDVCAPLLTDKNSSAIDAVALLDIVFVSVWFSYSVVITICSFRRSCVIVCVLFIASGDRRLRLLVGSYKTSTANLSYTL